MRVRHRGTGTIRNPFCRKFRTTLVLRRLASQPLVKWFHPGRLMIKPIRSVNAVFDSAGWSRMPLNSRARACGKLENDRVFPVVSLNKPLESSRNKQSWRRVASAFTGRGRVVCDILMSATLLMSSLLKSFRYCRRAC